MSNPVEYYDQVKLDDCDPESKDYVGLTTIGWYFWDETWTQVRGPYGTEEAAKKIYAAYCKRLIEEVHDGTASTG